MEAFKVIKSFQDAWICADKWQLLTFLIAAYAAAKCIYGKLQEVCSSGFCLLEKYRAVMNKKEHDQENIETIDELRAGIQACNDKINVISHMLLELKEIIENNEKKNAAEHQAMEEQRNSARRETLKQQLYVLYYKYRDREAREGKQELSSVEYEGFWSMFHEYEEPPLNGNGQIHSTVEPYMRGFVENPDRE